MNKTMITKEALANELEITQEEANRFIELAIKLRVFKQGYRLMYYEYYEVN